MSASRIRFSARAFNISGLGLRMNNCRKVNCNSISGLAGVRNYYPPVPRLTTLDPGKLTSACFRDFSRSKQVALYLPEMTDIGLWTEVRKVKTFGLSRPLAGRSGKGYSAVPFPNDTWGFLYYRAPPSWGHDLAGEIRFRVTEDANPANFYHGHDISFKGVPWHIPLLPYTSLSSAFHDVLLQDGLLTPDQAHRLQRFSSYRRQAMHTRLLYAVGQPFVMRIDVDKAVECRNRQIILGKKDGEDTTTHISIGTSKGVQWAYAAADGAPQPFTERAFAVVHLEPWTRPKHDAKRCVRMRIRKLLKWDGSPVGSEDDHPDYGATGGVVWTIANSKRKMWYHDLDTGSEGWRYLRTPPDGVVMDL